MIDKAIRIKTPLKVREAWVTIDIPIKEDVQNTVDMALDIFGEGTEIVSTGIPLNGQAKQVEIIPSKPSKGEGSAGYDLENYILTSAPHMGDKLSSLPLEEVREWFSMDKDTIQKRDQGAIRAYLKEQKNE